MHLAIFPPAPVGGKFKDGAIGGMLGAAARHAMGDFGTGTKAPELPTAEIDVPTTSGGDIPEAEVAAPTLDEAAPSLSPGNAPAYSSQGIVEEIVVVGQSRSSTQRIEVPQGTQGSVFYASDADVRGRESRRANERNANVALTVGAAAATVATGGVVVSGTRAVYGAFMASSTTRKLVLANGFRRALELVTDVEGGSSAVPKYDPTPGIRPPSITTGKK